MSVGSRPVCKRRVKAVKGDAQLEERGRKRFTSKGVKGARRFVSLRGDFTVYFAYNDSDAYPSDST